MLAGTLPSGSVPIWCTELVLIRFILEASQESRCCYLSAVGLLIVRKQMAEIFRSGAIVNCPKLIVQRLRKWPDTCTIITFALTYILTADISRIKDLVCHL